MPRTFATITDLAAHLADGMDLDREAVTEAIRSHYALFGTFGRIPATELAALSAAVWTHITGHEYPEAWADALAQDELTTEDA